VPHPELLKALGTLSAIPKMCVPEAPEGMVACLVIASMWVHEPEFLERRMKVPANDI